MKILVLGSGIEGICSAWWLTQAGHEVTIIDRCSDVALETSFANGGQISVSYAEPWAYYKNLPKIINWLLKSGSPLSFKLGLDVKQWMWSLSFLWQCIPKNFENNLLSIIRLADYSRNVINNFNHEFNIEYESKKCGILRFYSNNHDLKLAKKFVSIMNNLGIERNIVSKEEIFKLEPTLYNYEKFIVGGDYTSTDESGNAYLFTKNLAKLCKEHGCSFHFNTNINKLIKMNNKIDKIEIIRSDGYYDYMSADAYVVALGSYSPILLKSVGISNNIYPAKGYSATFNIKNQKLAPQISLIDNNNKLVISNLGKKLRVAGFVELSGYSRYLDDKACQKITTIMNNMFPDALNIDNVNYWSGLRPATPSGIPYIGKTKFSNLYINSGHGPLGWTMSMGSAKALSDIVNNQNPEIIFPFLKN